MNLSTFAEQTLVARATSLTASRRPFMAPEPILQEASIGIRPFKAEDGHDLFIAAKESREELATWMVWCKPDYSCQDCDAFISSCDTKWHMRECYNFVIFETLNGDFLGSVSLNHINWTHNYANIGYWVRSSRVGRGIAPAAVRLVTTFGFLALGLSRLEMVVQLENLASRRVAEKVGANPEGILKNRLLMHSKPCDAILYSLTADDTYKDPEEAARGRADVELAWMR